ncbi:hypothetical protein NIES267_42340 [Calothrix parasitica NIES-267]|uniref:Uncharacterized protein n=1 Tax=Calothrix parasitica NIES-267 TaxID=1973488 RepID=A0A1Z4LUI2_9CYAN|nr:hypothetical protein NIES267_42340 [Calothrix parasitica NIES-267]
MPPHIYQFSKLQLSKHKVIYLALLIIFVILIIFAFYNDLSTKKRITTWRSVEEVTPKSLLKKVITKKSTRYLDISSIKVMQIPSNGSGDLYIFDYGSPQLCGAGGCLYSVYNSDGKTLLEFIANPKLPKSQKLIKVGENVNQGFPCLNITQITYTDKLLSQTEFCYQNSTYVPLNKNFITEKNE